MATSDVAVDNYDGGCVKAKAAEDGALVLFRRIQKQRQRHVVGAVGYALCLTHASNEDVTSGLRIDAAVLAHCVSEKDIPEHLHGLLRVVSELLTAAEDIFSAAGIEAGECV